MGFIRAEVIPYEVFAEFGSEQAVKEAGRLRVEGQGYVVADGDIVHVLFQRVGQSVDDSGGGPRAAISTAAFVSDQRAPDPVTEPFPKLWCIRR